MVPIKTFMNKVQIIFDKKSCWNWKGFIRPDGYSYFRGNYIHRHSILLFRPSEVLTKDSEVCHTCDNRSCVRPSHLVVADALWNARDRDKKGRANTAKGESAGHAKLKAADIPEIFKMKKAGVSTAIIAHKFSVSKAAIVDVLLKRTWKSVG